MTNRTAHTGLERCNKRIAEARAAEREAELREARANAAVEDARDRVREIHGVGGDPAESLAALDTAKREAEEAQLGREGVQQRAARAIAALNEYKRENYQALLGEIEADCERAREDLIAAMQHLIDADAGWRREHTRGDGYIAAAGLQPNINSPTGHGLEDLVRQAKRALNAINVQSPLPHLHGRHAATRERETVERMHRERQVA